MLGHLTDDDLNRFFKTMARSLTPQGFLVAKENICSSSSKFILDEEDSPTTRSKEEYERIFAASGLSIIQ